MKKYLLTLSLAGLLAFGLSSCSKDNGGLVGTTWVQNGYNQSYTEIISFLTYTEVEIEYEDWDDWEIISGTYTYNEPNVTITIREGGEAYRSTGIISGNTLTIYYDNGEEDVYIKKTN
jgi:hypothetical protein